MVYKTIKDIVFQREEYEFLMNNKECFIEFQLTSNLLNNDNIITIEININEEGFEYNDAFEWDVMNNMKM